MRNSGLAARCRGTWTTCPTGGQTRGTRICRSILLAARWYNYDQHGDAYRVWSMGPDGRNRTTDDIVLDSRDRRKR